MISWIACVAMMGASPDGSRVLVVVNEASAASKEIGAYYMAKRKVPKANLCLVNVPAIEDITPLDYNNKIEVPVYQAIKKAGHPIDFILTTKGVPLLIREGKFSVDAFLMHNGTTREALHGPIPDQIRRAANPYYGKDEPFTKAKFGFSLATRIDGYTVEDAKALIDRALIAKPAKGPFLFDSMGSLGIADGWRSGDDKIKEGATGLKARGLNVTLDESSDFAGPRTPLMGYVSWGSNDHKFDPTKYLGLRFQPGAIAETFVSTSARTMLPTSGGQSLIADLVAQGVTGVKGYASEPYLFAMADPRVLFDRYTKGYNLAESFYMASPILKWKDVIIGDPLCAPYAK